MSAYGNQNSPTLPLASLICTAEDEEWFNVVAGDLVKTPCSSAALLGLYLEGRGSPVSTEESATLGEDNPIADLDSLHVRHLHAANADTPRRSARLLELSTTTASSVQSFPRKRKRSSSADSLSGRKITIKDERCLRWMESNSKLKTPAHNWTLRHGFVPDPPEPNRDAVPKTAKKHARPSKNSRKNKRGGRNAKNKDGSTNANRDLAMAKRALERSDQILTSTFTLLHDASRSTTGWQGAQPPKMARQKIHALYYAKPQASALMPYLAEFFPVPYIMKDGSSGRQERGTFIVDNDGLVFLYRSVRAMWLADLIEELEEAQHILLGEDLESEALKAACAGGVRGPHLAVILGHQKQSSVAPYLTAWHRAHADRVAKFLGLDVMKRIFRWVAMILRTIWPGLAARFDRDAAWHWDTYKIRPLFGYFWNFCYNAAFHGQQRIHTGPHVDFKNQIGICFILTYVLKSGLRFNHKIKGWIVLWEAGVAIELPPWTLAGYPSALFYHFNVDIDKLLCVWTDVDVEKPTPENSHPFEDVGRGSMVFFSQSTMRHGPGTGYETLEMAMEAGLSGQTDFDSDIQTAFENELRLTPLPDDFVANCGDRTPEPSDFGG